MDNNNGQDQYGQQLNQGYPQQDMSQQYGQADASQQYSQYGQTDASQQYSQYGQTDASQQYSQYGQADASQQYYTEQPQVTGGDGGNPKKEKKPLGNGAKIGIICGGVALVAAIICGIIFLPGLFKTDRDVVLDAFANTFGVSESTDDYMEETFGFSEIQKKAEETGSNATMNLNLNSVQGIDDLGELSVSINSNRDSLNKEASSGYVISYNGTDIINVSGYTDNTDMYVAVNNLISGYLSLPCEDGITAFVDSVFGEALELEDSGLTGDLKFFSDDEDAAEDDSADSDLVAAIDNAWNDTVFKKEGKTTVDVNGDAVSAKEYTVTISEENLENIFTEFLNEAANSYTAVDDSEMDEDTYKAYIDQIKSYIPDLISSDYVLNVYIADDKVVKMTSDTEISFMGLTISCDFDMDINDDLSGEFVISVLGESVGISCDIKDFKTSPNGDIILSVSDEDIIDVAVESDDSISDDSRNINKKITCYYEDEQLLMIGIDWNSDRNANSFSGTFGLYGEDSSEDIITLSFDGQFENIVKGESYDVNFGNISVSSGGEQLFGLSAEYSFGTSPQVEGIDSSLPVYDITTMTETDLAEIFMGSDLYISWLENIAESGLSDLFGSASSFVIDEIEDDYLDYDEDDIYEDDEDDDEMTNVLVSYDDNLEVEILGTIQNLDMTYGCEYFVDFEDENYDLTIEYCLEDETTEWLLENFTFYDEDAIQDSSYNQSITISDGTTIEYDVLYVESYGETRAKYYFVRDLGNGHVLTADVYDYTNSVAVEELAETLAGQYFSVK